jgi:hypothetical protein
MLSLTLAAAMLASSGQWDGLKFLIGDWSAQDGAFSLNQELNGRILVRKNHSTAKGNVHDDLMVIYRDSANDSIRATFWDNEGHVIQYKVTANGNSAVFQSDASAPGPQYRLTYENKGPAQISIRFEVAPPGKDFQIYLHATANRTAPRPQGSR